MLVELNDADLRAGREKATGQDVKMTITFYWVARQNMEVVYKETQLCWLDYAKHTGVKVPIKNKHSNLVLVEILFDEVLMYEDYINLSVIEAV